MKVISTFLVVILFAAGCTTLKEVMSSWEGRPVDELLSAWGAPDSRIQLKDGGQVLTWTTLWNDADYGIHTCRKSFTVDSDGIIVKWSYSDCQVYIGN